MPTYEYRCNSCGHEFELFQTMKELPVSICPKCKGPVQRLIGTGAGPIFKGTGFYQTDYKNSDNKSSSENKTSKEGSEAKKVSDKGKSKTKADV